MQFIVYSKTNCAACVTAKNMITAAGHSYEERVLFENLTREEFMSECPGARSMPQIKLDGEIISMQQLAEKLA